MPQTGLIPVLDALCPMHLVLSGDATVLHAGATLRKLRPSRDMAGVAFLDLFEVQIVNGIVNVDTGKQRKRSAFDPEQATYPEQA